MAKKALTTFVDKGMLFLVGGWRLENIPLVAANIRALAPCIPLLPHCFPGVCYLFRAEMYASSRPEVNLCLATSEGTEEEEGTMKGGVWTICFSRLDCVRRRMFVVLSSALGCAMQLPVCPLAGAGMRSV